MVTRFNKVIFFSLFPLILSLGIAPALPFVDAVPPSDVFDCRDGQVLARNLQHGYLKCMEESKADTFVRLGLVELVTEESEEEAMDKIMMEPEIRKDEVETELETPSPASTQEFEPAPALPTAVRVNPFYWSANGFGIDILRSFNLPICLFNFLIA